MGGRNGAALAVAATHRVGDRRAPDLAQPQDGRQGLGPRAAVLVYAITALVLVYTSAVLTPVGQAIDTAMMTALSAAVGRTTWAPALLTVISPATLLIGTALLAMHTLRRRGWLAAGVVTAVVLGTAAVAQVLKDVLVRPELLTDFATNSLPSGHVAAVAGLSVAAWIAADRERRVISAVLGGITVAATGLATIVTQWHRPSDVVASALIAVAAGAIASDSPWLHRHDSRVAPRVGSEPSRV